MLSRRKEIKMAKMKQSRWVRVVSPGQSRLGAGDEKQNIMAIQVGDDRCRAEVTYTCRSFKKAAYWLCEYLKSAGATEFLSEGALAQIQTAATAPDPETREVRAKGENWDCTIQEMGGQCYYAWFNWRQIKVAEA